jgi:hypothetical protein
MPERELSGICIHTRNWTPAGSPAGRLHRAARDRHGPVHRIEELKTFSESCIRTGTTMRLLQSTRPKGCASMQQKIDTDNDENTYWPQRSKLEKILLFFSLLAHYCGKEVVDVLPLFTPPS